MRIVTPYGMPEKSSSSLYDVGDLLLKRLIELRPEVLDRLRAGPGPGSNRREAAHVFSEITRKIDALSEKIYLWLKQIQSSEFDRIEYVHWSPDISYPGRHWKMMTSGRAPSRKIVVQYYQWCFDNWEQVLRHELECWPLRTNTVRNTRSQKRRRGRETDQLVKLRRAAIQRVSKIYPDNPEKYCEALAAAGLSTPVQWQKNEGCPKSYFDAWNHPNPSERKKWRKRIKDQRRNDSKAYDTPQIAITLNH